MWLRAADYTTGYIICDTSRVSKLAVTERGKLLTLQTMRKNEDGIEQSLLRAQYPASCKFSIDGQLEPHSDYPLAILEWIDDSVSIHTRLWHASSGILVESELKYVTGFGSFYRIVVETPLLLWGADRVFRIDNDSVRFVRGKISGHRASQSTSKLKGGEATTQAKFGPETIEGSFIEIIARSRGKLDGMTRASSILGFIGLVFGPTALGRRIFESQIEAPRQGDFLETSVAPLQWNYNVDLPNEAFDVGLGSFSDIMSSTNKAAVRALERYGQGLSASNDELRLSGFYSGIEVLCRDFEKRKGGVPKIRSRFDQHSAAFTEILDSLGDDPLKQKILNSLGHVSIRESFDFYAAQNKLATEEALSFKEINSQRNSLFHEADASSLYELAEKTKRLLQQMLAIELNIPMQVIWDRYPEFRIGFPVTFPEYGWDKRPAIDENG